MTAFGFLNVNKPLHLTSHDVVARLRRGLHIKKVGHAGTLDPLATGVLVICVGAATRLSEYVMHATKQYQARIHLGVETTTYDAEGNILTGVDASAISRLAVETALSQFIGAVEQVPPMHSAIKQGGRKLYELARAGQVVEREPRAVTIDSLEITDWNPPVVTVRVVCSAGTYIRSLAHDLGAVLGVGAHLSGLVRTASGNFHLKDALELDTLLSAADWQHYLIPPLPALRPMPVIQFEPEDVLRLVRGQVVQSEGVTAGTLAQAYAGDGRLIAIVRGDDAGWHPHKVFA